MANSRGGKISSVGEVLGKLKRATPLGKQLKQAQLWERWPEIVGEELAPHCLPHRVVRGHLRILAESTVWMNKLAYHKRAILGRINKLAGRDLATDLFVQLADTWPPEFAQKDTGSPSAKDTE